MANQEHALAEQLFRMELKLDVIMRHLSIMYTESSFVPLKDKQHFCSLCGQAYQKFVDQSTNMLSTRCGCRMGLLPMLTGSTELPQQLPHVLPSISEGDE